MVTELELSWPTILALCAIWAIVALVAISPIAIKGVRNAKWHQPFLGVWAGVMIPVVFIAARKMLGFGGRCDIPMIGGGLFIFLLLVGQWAIAILLKRKKGPEVVYPLSVEEQRWVSFIPPWVVAPVAIIIISLGVLLSLAAPPVQ